MKMTLLGTGTSHGVPVIGCSCKTCTSKDPRDNRYRTSAFIEPYNFLIDTGPEFRLQALRKGITSISAAFITHSHADHLNGLDDLRTFSHSNAPGSASAETEGDGLPVYADKKTISDIKRRFDYAFTPPKEGGGKPKLKLIEAEQFFKDRPLIKDKLSILPVPLLHGTLTTTGWLFTQTENGIKKSIAYLTDCNDIPEQSLALIKENAGVLVHLVIDGLRKEKHSTHFSFEEALCFADKLCPLHTWITHITHNMSHLQIKEFLEEKLCAYKNLTEAVQNGGSVLPAFDGLELEV